MEECEVHLLPQIHQKIHLHMEQVSQNTYRMLAEDITLLKGQKESPYNQVGPKKRKESGQDLHPLEGTVKDQRLPHPPGGKKRGLKIYFKVFLKTPQTKEGNISRYRKHRGPQTELHQDIIKMAKVTILKAVREKQSADLSTETLQARRE